MYIIDKIYIYKKLKKKKIYIYIFISYYIDIYTYLWIDCMCVRCMCVRVVESVYICKYLQMQVLRYSEISEKSICGCTARIFIFK